MIYLEPCVNYKWLNDTSRSNLLNPTTSQKDLECDVGLKDVWYRFSTKNISQVLATKCSTEAGTCKTIAGGWMNGEHPSGIYFIHFSHYVTR